MYRQWVPCERNFSYNFIPIFLKLFTCFLHGLKMCMWFGYSPCFNFCTFSLCELCHFLTSDSMKVYRQWVPCECNSSYNFIPIFSNFAHVFSMVWRCACGLDIILELMFVTFSTMELCHFLTSDCMKVYRQWVACKCNSLYNFILIFMQLCTSFFHGLKMCMWFGFNPGVNFCHFSTLLTLSFFQIFAGGTSTSLKFTLYFIGSSSNLLVTRTGIKSLTSSNSGRIGSDTLELHALEHQKNSLYNYTFKHEYF